MPVNLIDTEIIQQQTDFFSLAGCRDNFLYDFNVLFVGEVVEFLVEKQVMIQIYTTYSTVYY